MLWRGGGHRSKLSSMNNPDRPLHRKCFIPHAVTLFDTVIVNPFFYNTVVWLFSFQILTDDLKICQSNVFQLFLFLWFAWQILVTWRTYITFLPPDAPFALSQIVLPMSSCPNVLSCCHAIGRLDNCVDEQLTSGQGVHIVYWFIWLESLFTSSVVQHWALHQSTKAYFTVCTI